MIDDDPGSWPVERLHQIKDEHQEWFRSVADPSDQANESIDFRYAVIVDGWAHRAQLDIWSAWTSHLLGSRPTAFRTDLDSLGSISYWLFSRAPGTRGGLEQAIENFRRVGKQLCSLLVRSMTDWADDQVLIETFYKRDWNDNYDRDLDAFEWIVLLIHDLVFELTRAGNWVLEEVRSDLDPLYRVDEGVLTVVREQGVMNFVTWRPAYTAEELRNGKPFVDVRNFAIDREVRDVHFGIGLNEDGYRRVAPIRLGDD